MNLAKNRSNSFSTNIMSTDRQFAEISRRIGQFKENKFSQGYNYLQDIIQKNYDFDKDRFIRKDFKCLQKMFAIFQYDLKKTTSQSSKINAEIKLKHRENLKKKMEKLALEGRISKLNIQNSSLMSRILNERENLANNSNINSLYQLPSQIQSTFNVEKNMKKTKKNVEEPEFNQDTFGQIYVPQKLSDIQLNQCLAIKAKNSMIERSNNSTNITEANQRQQIAQDIANNDRRRSKTIVGKLKPQIQKQDVKNNEEEGKYQQKIEVEKITADNLKKGSYGMPNRHTFNPTIDSMLIRKQESDKKNKEKKRQIGIQEEQDWRQVAKRNNEIFPVNRKR